jgi:hypothetical protein
MKLTVRIARHHHLTSSSLALVGLALALLGCAQSRPNLSAGAIAGNGCSAQRPASWPESSFIHALGPIDRTLDSPNGALFLEVKTDSSNPAPLNASQVLLQRAGFRRDTLVRDSIKMTVPAGRYFFRVRGIGLRPVQDSIDIRIGYVDTLHVVLGRELLCLMSGSHQATRQRYYPSTRSGVRF